MDLGNGKGSVRLVSPEFPDFPLFVLYNVVVVAEGIAMLDTAARSCCVFADQMAH